MGIFNKLNNGGKKHSKETSIIETVPNTIHNSDSEIEKAIAEKANSDQDSIDLQQNIKGVLDMIAAMQQLTFAVEAFHNIGSI